MTPQEKESMTYQRIIAMALNLPISLSLDIDKQLLKHRENGIKKTKHEFVLDLISLGLREDRK
jgi:FixJ family two-component response regulator